VTVTQLLGEDMAAHCPSLELEKGLWADGYRRVAGLDEAGRGAWAGPVVAAVVILPRHRADLLAVLDRVRDSKQLTARTRELLYPVICETALAVGVGMASPRFIDVHRIVAATRRAMMMALHNLGPRADYLLVDALSLPAKRVPQQSLVKGDAHVLSIAAASVVAKVTRDRWMVAVDSYHAGYSFASNKGYGTPAHRAALQELGPCPAHRMSFAPLRPWADSPSGH
jgi:ribonuclease HII